MAIGDGDDDIFFNEDDFAEEFSVEGSGQIVVAIFNEASGLESVVGFDIDFSKPFLTAGASVAILLTQGTVILRGAIRYQVSARPASQGDGVYLIPLTII